MCLERLFDSMEAGLSRFGRRICRDPKAGVRDEADSTREALARRRDRLAHCRDEMEELRRRVRVREARAALLASRVQCYLHVCDGPSAFDHAMELDDVRRSLAEDRGRLREALRTERRHLECLADLRDDLRRLNNRLAGGRG